MVFRRKIRLSLKNKIKVDILAPQISFFDKHTIRILIKLSQKVNKEKVTKIKNLILAAVFLAAFLLLGIFSNEAKAFWWTKDNSLRLSAYDERIIFLSYENISGKIVTHAKTIEDFLKEQKINIDSMDIIIPEKKQSIFSGMNIIIQHSKKATIGVDGKKVEGNTFSKNVADFIQEKNISIKDEDIVVPERQVALADGVNIKITRVEIKEEIKNQPLDFKEIANEDDKLGWRIKKITQKGEKGNLAITYSVAYHDNKEVSRKIIKKETTNDPVPQIVTQGTYMKLGKANKGDASYYASSWGELNASRSIPRGGFAKVTNLDNGKAVIVKINDYGPQSPQRVIDLSYASFSKIGDLGQGILHNVKVEQVLN